MKQAKLPELPVLLVDDEEDFLLSTSFTLAGGGINNVVQCHDSREVMPLLAKQDFSVVVLDMNMPYIPGWELLPMISREFPDIRIIVITGIDEIETAVDIIKAGASDYLVKPVKDARLVTTIRNEIEMREMQSENALLKQYLLSDELQHPEAFTGIITNSDSMRSIFQYVEAIARTSMPVLITGETGVGKELIARAAHDLSGRTGEFVPLNVAGVDDALFSDTLFGHKRGAFTSADQDRKGLIEQAAAGTMFLDEIGDLGLESQVKLLRLLQEGKYYAIGSDVSKLSDARVIVATNRDIASMQERDEFRKDLYYRLQTHHIHIPPLRERKEDIPALMERFLTKSAEELGKKRPTPPRELPTLLSTYHFPGNVRELESMIFDAVSRHRSGVLSMESFRGKTSQQQAPLQTTQSAEAVAQEPSPLESEKQIAFPDQLPTLKETEQMLVAEALKRAEGNQTIAAQLLGLSRRALNNRLNRAKE